PGSPSPQDVSTPSRQSRDRESQSPEPPMFPADLRSEGYRLTPALPDLSPTLPPVPGRAPRRTAQVRARAPVRLLVLRNASEFPSARRLPAGVCDTTSRPARRRPVRVARKE